jgi:aminopeptidase N
LYDEKNSAAKSRERIAYVVGHELAHQWFGNLVSPDWWSDLWLNEGMPVYLKFNYQDLLLGLDGCQPTTYFLIGMFGPSLLAMIYNAV